MEEISISDIILPSPKKLKGILAQLEASIEDNGILVPIIVYVNVYIIARNESYIKFGLIDGYHRVIVAKQLGIKTIKALVIECDENQFKELKQYNGN